MLSRIANQSSRYNVSVASSRLVTSPSLVGNRAHLHNIVAKNFRSKAKKTNYSGNFEQKIHLFFKRKIAFIRAYGKQDFDIRRPFHLFTIFGIPTAAICINIHITQKEELEALVKAARLFTTL